MEKTGGEAEVKEVKIGEEDSSPTAMDPVFVSCLLQPPTSHHDPNYVAIRRLLHSKAQSLLQRKDHIALVSNASDQAEGIGNGIPIGAVVTTPDIATVLTRRNYFNTFGGNLVCTAAGHSVLRVIEKERLQENAFLVGSYLKGRLKDLQEKHEIIGDVRGRDMMLGVELVTDQQAKTPAKVEILHILDQMKVAKPLVVDGIEKSHSLSLAYDSFSLSQLHPPLLLQEFVYHGGVLFKVYIVEEAIKVVHRFSLPDVDRCQLLKNAGVYHFLRVSVDDADLDLSIVGCSKSKCSWGMQL